MGLSGISPGSLILILVIIVVLFGTKKLREVGNDLGVALKGLRRHLESPEEVRVADEHHDCQHHHEEPSTEHTTQRLYEHTHEHHHPHDGPCHHGHHKT